MVNVWTASRVGNVITLNTGEVIDIDSFSGSGWTENRCANITDNVQENFLDNVVDRDLMPADDPEKTWTEQDFIDRYGQFGVGRGTFVELNTQGQSNEIRYRHTVVTVYPEGASFNVSWRRV
jgi:hypothetical protein